MDSAETLKMAKGIWDEDLRQRKQAFRKRVHAVHSKLSEMGAAGGPLLSAVLNEAVQEERERAALAREVLERTVTTTGQRPSFSELTSIYRDLTTDIFQDLKEAYRDTISTIGVDREQAAGMLLPLGAEGVQTLKQQVSFLELFASAAPTNPPTSVTQIGAIQYGTHAVANIVQNFNPSESAELARLRDALESMRTELGSTRGADSTSIAPIILDIERELVRPEPRKPIVQSLFVGLSASVEILGNAPAAWATVKTLAALAGLHVH